MLTEHCLCPVFMIGVVHDRRRLDLVKPLNKIITKTTTARKKPKLKPRSSCTAGRAGVGPFGVVTIVAGPIGALAAGDEVSLSGVCETEIFWFRLVANAFNASAANASGNPAIISKFAALLPVLESADSAKISVNAFSKLDASLARR